jgi:hypothetical protein
MNTAESALVAIPIVDVRDGGPRRHAAEAHERARALRDECVGWLPGFVRPALPLMDGVTRRWLHRSCSPYVAEIAAIAATLKFPGVWFLNGSYVWGCTSLGCEQGGVPWLARTLDWPFPGLGRHVEVARMAGPGGEFWSVTWPGAVGVLTAMAPGRFGVCLNQAPLWRRTRHPWLRPYDVARNAMRTWSLGHMPPDQMLRQVLEECRTFVEAKQRLETVPVARPAIYTLVGCNVGERCVIERQEESFATRQETTSAANDWLVRAEPWEARIGGDIVFTCSYDEAAQRSHRRRQSISEWRGSFAGESFSWVVPPVLNKYTRLAAEMCPAQGILRVVGYERPDGADLAEPVTRPCEISSALAPAA